MDIPGPPGCGWSLIAPVSPQAPHRAQVRMKGVWVSHTYWPDVAHLKIRCMVDGPPFVLLPQTLPMLSGPACVGVFLKAKNNLSLENRDSDYSRFSCLTYKRYCCFEVFLTR